jgi:hypothetical protein
LAIASFINPSAARKLPYPSLILRFVDQLIRKVFRIARERFNPTLHGDAQCNEAVASVAYRLNEFFPIYPITPSSPVAEFADEWSAAGRKNLWGAVPSVVEMQSESGAAGALHGALQAGSLSASITASQELLLQGQAAQLGDDLVSAILTAASYGTVYDARVALGAKDGHTVSVFREAESYDGPSLIIAYSHCVAYG